MGRTVIFYKTADGKCPVQEFLDSLPGKAAQKVAWVLNVLEDVQSVPSSYFKKLAGTEEMWGAGFNLRRMPIAYFVSLLMIQLY